MKELTIEPVVFVRKKTELGCPANHKYAPSQARPFVPDLPACGNDETASPNAAKTKTGAHGSYQ